MGAGYGMMSGGMYGNQYEPRVQPGYYGVPGADAGRYVADAFMQQQQLNRSKQQQAHEDEMDPLEVALYKAKLREAGVTWPHSGGEPTPGAGGNGAPPAGGGVSPGMPARRIPLQLPAPYAGDPTMGGADVAPTVSMPGAFNPATNAHNTVLPPSQGASTPAASGVGAGPPAAGAPGAAPGGVPLGGGFMYNDPANARVKMFTDAGFSPSDAQMMARDPNIAREMVTQRGEAPYKETPGAKLSDAETLERLRAELQGQNERRLATAKGEIAPHGQMTRKQMQDWVDTNYEGMTQGPDGASMPALTPSRRIALAENLYQSQFNAPRPNAAPPSRSLFQPHTAGAPAPPPGGTGGGAPGGSPAPAAGGAPAPATPPASQQPTVTPTAPSGAQPKAPGAAPPPAAGGTGRVLQGDDAISAAADSLANHPEVTDAQAHQLLRTKYGFDDSHVAQVLRLRRSRGRPAA